MEEGKRNGRRPMPSPAPTKTPRKVRIRSRLEERHDKMPAMVSLSQMQQPIDGALYRLDLLTALPCAECGNLLVLLPKSYCVLMQARFSYQSLSRSFLFQFIGPNYPPDENRVSILHGPLSQPEKHLKLNVMCLCPHD